MECYFEKVSKFKDVDFPFPERKTKNSAGYDLAAAEDIVIPSYLEHYFNLFDSDKEEKVKTLEELASMTKALKAKPTLVPTGVKCHLPSDKYLELSVRSSTPLKYWLIMANGIGVIDSDYCDNPDNEGLIFLQMINLSPFPIHIHRGDIIGQGIIKSYNVVDNDSALGERVGGFGSTSTK